MRRWAILSMMGLCLQSCGVPETSAVDGSSLRGAATSAQHLCRLPASEAAAVPATSLCGSASAAFSARP